MSQDMNHQLALIGGISGTGKSASLMTIPNQERWAYLNCEAGKHLPFKNKFNTFRITDPYQVHEAFDHFTNDASASASCDGIIVDTITFMMDMFETQYVINSANTMQGWGNYNQFFTVLMQDKVVKFGKPVLMLAHTREDLDEKAMEMKTAVPIKGALKNQGVEAYFSTVVATKKVSVKELEPFANAMLNITEEDMLLGFKHVFQTRLTQKTVGERIRSPMGLFTREETYMDNDAHKLLQHLQEFYA
jgi:hypothetical protein